MKKGGIRRIHRKLSADPVGPGHIVPRGGKKYFFMFSKTSLNTNFWKVHRFFGFSKKKKKKILQNLYPF